MDPSRGHCNGTRYIVRQVSPRCITVEISCGEYSGNILFIPRIPLSPTDAGLPFTLHRRQFPVRPAFAMTINKAQGQTLQRSGVLLEEPVYTHRCMSHRGVVGIQATSDFSTEWSDRSCYLTPATPASYTSKEPPMSLPAFIDSKPARGKHHGVGYVFENKCTAGTTVETGRMSD